MASLNKVLIIGNLVAEPELKQTTSGISVCSFSVAVNRPYVKEKKPGVPDVDFINVVAWRNTADFLCTYFGKGDPVFILGALQVRSWTDSDGNKRYATEVIADEVSFVRSKMQQAGPESSSENFHPEAEEVSP